MLFANGKLYKRVPLTVTNSAGFLLDSMFDFAERMNDLRLTDEEMALFSAIVIIAAGETGVFIGYEMLSLKVWFSGFGRW